MLLWRPSPAAAAAPVTAFAWKYWTVTVTTNDDTCMFNSTKNVNTQAIYMTYLDQTTSIGHRLQSKAKMKPTD